MFIATASNWQRLLWQKCGNLRFWSRRDTDDRWHTPKLEKISLTRASLRKIWHACPKWHAETFPSHAAFTAVPTFHFLCPTGVSILWRTRVYVHVCDCLETLPPNNTVSEILLHNSGALWSIDRIFIIRALLWRWLDEYVTLDRMFLQSFETGSSSSATYCHIFFFITFLQEAFIINIIIITCINCINIIWINDNKAVINNNYGRLQDLILLFRIPMGTRKYFFEICWQFGHALLKNFASPGLCFSHSCYRHCNQSRYRPGVAQRVPGS